MRPYSATGHFAAFLITFVLFQYHVEAALAQPRSTDQLISDYEKTRRGHRVIRTYALNRLRKAKSLIISSLSAPERLRAEQIEIRVIISSNARLAAMYKTDGGVPRIVISTGLVRYISTSIDLMRHFPQQVALDYFWYLEEYANLTSDISGENPVSGIERVSVDSLVRDHLSFAKLFQTKKEFTNSRPGGIEACRAILTIDFALAFVLAHEMAHHMLGHDESSWSTFGESRERESEADEWAMDVLTRAGIPITGGGLVFVSWAAINRLQLHPSSPTHPSILSRYQRLLDQLDGAFDQVIRNAHEDWLPPEPILQEYSQGWKQGVGSLKQSLEGYDEELIETRGSLEKYRTSVIEAPYGSKTSVISPDWRVVSRHITARIDRNINFNYFRYDNGFWHLVSGAASDPYNIFTWNNNFPHLVRDIRTLIQQGYQLDSVDCDYETCLAGMRYSGVQHELEFLSATAIDELLKDVERSQLAASNIFYGLDRWNVILSSDPNLIRQRKIVTATSLDVLAKKINSIDGKYVINEIECSKTSCVALLSEDQSSYVIRTFEIGNIYDLRKHGIGYVNPELVEHGPNLEYVVNPIYYNGKWHFIGGFSQ